MRILDVRGIGRGLCPSVDSARRAQSSVIACNVLQSTRAATKGGVCDGAASLLHQRVSPHLLQYATSGTRW